MAEEQNQAGKKKRRHVEASSMQLQSRAMRRIDAALAPLADDEKRAVLAWLNAREATGQPSQDGQRR